MDATFSGTTCVVCIMTRRSLVCANSGDSRAILISNTPDNRWVVKLLSRDHKPDEPDEAARVRKAGGRIEQSRMQPQMTMPGMRQQ